jgi:hypothetical protein
MPYGWYMQKRWPTQQPRSIRMLDQAGQRSKPAALDA